MKPTDFVKDYIFQTKDDRVILVLQDDTLLIIEYAAEEVYRMLPENALYNKMIVKQ